MKKDTLIIGTGLEIEKHKGSINPPIYNSSSILFTDVDTYFQASQGISPYEKFLDDTVIRDYSYGADTNPTLQALSKALACLEIEEPNLAQTLIFPSGLSALVHSILALVESGTHILLPHNTYWRLRKFIQFEITKFQVTMSFYNPWDNVAALVQPNTKLIIIESPVSYTFEVTDIDSIVNLAKINNITTLIDNSWASPLYFKPLMWGIDVSVYSGTKYLSGYSDIRMGLVSCLPKYFPLLYKAYCNYGVNVSGYECYLAYRGLKTLSLRLERHYKTALTIAEYFEHHPKIKQILYPPAPFNSFYSLWKKYFTGGGGLLSIILNKEYSASSIAQMLNFTKVFKIGASWGGYQSLILPLDVNKITGAKIYQNRLLRLYCGLENVSDLIEDLENALARLE